MSEIESLRRKHFPYEEGTESKNKCQYQIPPNRPGSAADLC